MPVDATLIACRTTPVSESRAEDEFDVTVAVPTRNERDNVAPLLRRLEKIRPDLRLEVLFIDDSSDDTPRVIEGQAPRCSRTVSLIHRPERDRLGGLGGAVRAGLLAARSDLVCVMDADLQHPPELLGALVDEASGSRADVVVASRYCDQGDASEFSAFRLAVSRGSAMVAKALFPRRLRSVSDPMSGFFLVRRSAVDVGALRPKGFKILLEILLSGRALATREVAFRFGERHSGDSKASWREGVLYLRRLVELRIDRRWRRLAGFAAVGALGVAVNTGALALLTRDVHVFYLIASILATQIAILCNFALTEWLVFRGAQTNMSLPFRFTSYLLINNASLLISGPLLLLLVSAFEMDVLLANLLSLVLLALGRFAIADSYIWGSKSVDPALLTPTRATRRAGRLRDAPRGDRGSYARANSTSARSFPVVHGSPPNGSR
jgi:dolichol-phosphate mannosyltransferase